MDLNERMIIDVFDKIIRLSNSESDPEDEVF